MNNLLKVGAFGKITIPGLLGANPWVVIVPVVVVYSVWTHKAFAQKLGITYPLLADFHPKGKVAKKYGLYLEDRGIAARATVVIDKEGKVVRLRRIMDVPQQRNNQEILEVLKGLK